MIYIAIVLGVLGLCFGSFINALVWRLKNNRNWVSERSECTHCHHVLAPLDLIPVVSWLLLRGKCHYCHKPIEDTPWTEVIMGTLFVGSYLFWPTQLHLWYQWADFGLWLVFLVFLGALLLYDLRWYLLPDKLIYPLIALGLVDGLLRAVWLQHLSPLETVTGLAFGLLPIAGFYGLLYAASRGRWIGFGDVKLGAFMGLVLGWQGALLVLFLGNVIGTLVILPGLMSKTLNRQSRIPFGPFLIVGFITTGLFGNYLINWYISTYLFIR